MDEQDVSDIGLETGPGAWVITQHDLILEMSKTPRSTRRPRHHRARSSPRVPRVLQLDDRDGRPATCPSAQTGVAGFTPRMLNRSRTRARPGRRDRLEHRRPGALRLRRRCRGSIAIGHRVRPDGSAEERARLRLRTDRTSSSERATRSMFRTPSTSHRAARAGAALAELMTDVAESKRAATTTTSRASSSTPNSTASDSSFRRSPASSSSSSWPATRRPATRSAGVSTT